MIQKLAAGRTWKHVKRQLKQHLDADPRSNFVIFLDAGLTKNAYYKAFDKSRLGSKMRESTVHRLADSLNVSVTTLDGLPFFGNIAIEAKEGESIAELTRKAIDRAGDIEILSQMSHILILELSSIVSQSSKRTALSADHFHQIIKTTTLNISVDQDNVIIVQDDDEVISMLEQAPILAGQTDSARGDAHTNTIFDSGLLDLTSDENRDKHHITEEEVFELTHIQNSRNSNGSLDQWITILYAIRGLNQPFASDTD